MLNDKVSLTIRIPSELKEKLSYLSEATNRSVNGMICEMIESYSMFKGGNGNLGGMTKREYERYMKNGFESVSVELFDFFISKRACDYSCDKTASIHDAIDVSQLSGCYALVEGGEIVYVGSSVNLKNRMTSRKSNGWIASGNDSRTALDYKMKLSDSAQVLFWFTDEYVEMERDMIYTLDPINNLAMPAHKGKSEYMIESKRWRETLSSRLNETNSEKESKSISRLLDMRHYK